MMIRKLLSDNPNEVLRILFKKFGLKYDAYAHQAHKNHPLYPGFGSIAYVLSKYGIDSCLIETSYDELSQLPDPFVVHYDGLFLPIVDVTDTEISILNERGLPERQPRSMLHAHWTKTALIFDADKILKRKTPLKWFIRFIFNKAMLWVAFASICAGLIHAYATKVSGMNWLSYAFLTCGIAGTVIGILFQVQEFDRNNKFVNSICRSKRQHNSSRDCSSILDSEDARFLGLFSWADFGLLYFSFLTLLPLFFASNIVLSVTSLCSIAAVAYVPYSILYQWRIARKWCALCLMTQGVLVANFILAVISFVAFGTTLITDIPLIDYTNILFTGIVFTAVFTASKIFLKAFLHNQSAAKLFAMLKHDYAVKALLLKRERYVSTDDLNSIAINPEGTDRLIVVLNPVCTPCMKKMKQLMEFWQTKKDTRMDIVFLLDKNDSGSRAIAMKFLSVYYQEQGRFNDFLNDYISGFPASSHRYVCEKSDDKYGAMLIEQDKWCMANGITSTPTMFLNGMEMPAIYRINDFDYMIN